MEPKQSEKSPWMTGRKFAKYSGLSQLDLKYRREHWWQEGYHWRRSGPREFSYHVERIESFTWTNEANQ